jgi:hypothetical protein
MPQEEAAEVNLSGRYRNQVDEEENELRLIRQENGLDTFVMKGGENSPQHSLIEEVKE